MIYLVEDDKSIRELLVYTLNNSGLPANGFEKPSDFYRELRADDADLIILDIMLPECDGLTMLKNLRADEKTKHIPVMMLTAKGSEYDKVVGLDMGADDYMTKPFGVMELVSRVKALLRRVGDQDSEKIMRIGDLVIDDEKRKVFVEDKPVELTYKEYELLHYLAQNQEIVLPRDSIMEHIWHANCEIESRTLDVHIKTLRHKLGDAGKYIKTVRNVGYCMNLV